MSYRRNVYILGAGFSAEAGAPTVANFFRRSMELYKNPGSSLGDEGREIYKHIFDYRSSLEVAEYKVRIDPENIEDLFGLAEMASQLNDPNAEAARKNLIYVILRTLELTTAGTPASGVDIAVRSGTSRKNIYVPWSLYDLFVQTAARRWLPFPAGGIAQDAIISLNYDLLVERAMEKPPPQELLRYRGLPTRRLLPLYGLPDETQYPEGQSSNGDPPCRLRLFKLHGSANWAICPTCKDHRVKVLGVEESSITAAPGSCDECGKDMMGRLIVPPAWNKEEYLPALKSVWAGAAEAPSRAQRIWIFGYSMPDVDKFFRYLLAIALQRNHDLDEVVIVNSNIDDCVRIGDAFRALNDRKKVLRQPTQISGYIGRGTTFQDQLGQLHPSHYVAW